MKMVNYILALSLMLILVGCETTRYPEELRSFSLDKDLKGAKWEVMDSNTREVTSHSFRCDNGTVSCRTDADSNDVNNIKCVCVIT